MSDPLQFTLKAVHPQRSIKCWSAGVALRAEPGSCEPISELRARSRERERLAPQSRTLSTPTRPSSPRGVRGWLASSQFHQPTYFSSEARNLSSVWLASCSSAVQRRLSIKIGFKKNYQCVKAVIYISFTKLIILVLV